MVFFKKLQAKELKVFFIYTIVVALLTFVTFSSIYFFKFQIPYQLNVRTYVLFEYSLIVYFLFLIIKKTKFKRIIVFSLIPFVIFAIVDFYSSPHFVSPNFLLLEFLFGIVFLIYFFYEKMQIIALFPIYQRITFWICVGLFIYFSGNFFSLIFAKTSTDPAFKNQIRLVFSIVTITKNILLSLSLFGNEPAGDTDEDQFHIPNDINLDEFNVNQFKNT